MKLLRLAVATVALAVAGASVVVVAGESVEISSSRARASVVPPSRVTLSCPESPPDTATTTRLFALAPDAESTDGRLTAETLTDADPVVVGSAEASRVPLDIPLERANGPSVLVKGDGGLAPGATAYQYSVSRGPRRSGVAVSGCPEARNDWWFNGVDANASATSRLVLTNPTSGVAVVDVLIFGQQGAVVASGSRDIPLPPYSRESVDLARLAPGAESATVQVSASEGRVSAAIATTRVQGATPIGSDWIPAAAAPAMDVLVNGGLPAASGQRLTITNPGSREALVQAEALVSSGPFRPTALADLTVPPHSVLVTDITDIVERSSTPLHITSTVDITAAVVSTVSRPGQEFAASTTSSPLTRRPAVAPVLRDLRTTLCFAMTARSGGSVSVTLVDNVGETVSTDDLRIQGGASTCTLTSKPRTAYALVSADPSDSIQAVAHYTGRQGVSTVAIAPGVWTIRRPGVEPAP